MWVWVTQVRPCELVFQGGVCLIGWCFRVFAAGTVFGLLSRDSLINLMELRSWTTLETFAFRVKAAPVGFNSKAQLSLWRWIVSVSIFPGLPNVTRWSVGECLQTGQQSTFDNSSNGGVLELCPLYRGWNLSQQWLKVTRGHQVVCRRCDWGLVKPNKGKDTRHSTSLVNSSVHQWERRDLLVWVKEQEEQEDGERLHAASSALNVTERCLNNFHEYLMMVTSVTFEHCCWNEPEYWCSIVLQDCCCPRWCQMID